MLSLGVGKNGGRGGGGGTSKGFDGGKGGAHPAKGAPCAAHVSGQISASVSTGGNVRVRPKEAAVFMITSGGLRHVAVAPPNNAATSGMPDVQLVPMFTCAKTGNGSGKSVQRSCAATRGARSSSIKPGGLGYK